MMKSFFNNNQKGRIRMVRKFFIVIALELLMCSACYAANVEFIKIPAKIKNWWHKEAPAIDVGYFEIIGTIEDSKDYVDQLEDFEGIPSIKGILVKIDSGGGVPGASEIIFKTLKRIVQKKPVVVFVENFCCSGAYWIASASSHIVSPATALIGSVGVRKSQYLYNELPGTMYPFFKGKISDNSFYAGKYKATSDPFLFKEQTAQEKEYLQKIINELYEEFCLSVAVSRNLSLDKKEQWADGKVFLGKHALEIGLIDEIGTSANAKNYLGSLIAGSKSEPIVKLKRSKKQRKWSFWKLPSLS